MRPREQAGRNLRERRAGLENFNVGADPPMSRGRPLSPVPGEQPDPTGDPTGVVATACLYREISATREALTVAARDCQLDAREGRAGP